MILAVRPTWLPSADGAVTAAGDCLAMAPDADATRIVTTMVDSGAKPLRSSLAGLHRATSAKVKSLMDQLDSQLRVVCVPGRSGKSIGSEVFHLATLSASAIRKVLEVQQEERLVRELPNALLPRPLAQPSPLGADAMPPRLPLPQGQVLHNWKEDAASTLNASLTKMREELAERARLHGTISNERIAKMHRNAKHDAMSTAERQVWNTLAPQLVSANDRVAELEESMAELQRKVDDAERAASLCLGSASEQ
jgi:hypothetical protein